MRLVIFLFLLVPCVHAFTQHTYPQQYFRNPLNIPMDLSANFGELRNNHWHMGLDIRTQQRENLPVYAAAEGFVSRIKVEPGGFGQAIYIDHPNGYTTLYAHLNKFYPELEQYVKEKQYELESWAVDINIPENLFPVKKGTFIAYSGNTGGSAGPHVHFEIRDTKTEQCLNPLLFGFPIQDKVAPIVYRLAMYNRNESIHTQAPVLYSLSGGGGKYKVPSIINAPHERVSFAIQAIDRLSGKTNPNGIYTASVYCDGTPMSSFLLDDIGYNETRYMNAHIDYRYKKRGGPYLQHISKMPGDQSKVYKNWNNDGVIHLSDTAVHQVVIEVTDAYNNKSTVEFRVRLKPGQQIQKDDKSDITFYPGYMNVFEKEDFELIADEQAVYDTVSINYQRINKNLPGSISAAHQVGSETIPVHSHMTIRIKPALEIRPEHQDKIVIQKDNGGRGDVFAAKWQNGWVSAGFREFGTFQAFIDTIPPQLNSLGSSDTLNLAGSRSIVFRPKDKYGISSFRAELDGKWLRFTNDKYSSFIYTFDEKWERGVRQLSVTVTDLVGNSRTESWWIRR